jgi:hypothetical protein
MTPFSGWENFYVIVGSSAGGLIGLQFVVITLIADFPITTDAEPAGSAFAKPTIVHFGSVLLIAAILSAPWQGIGRGRIIPPSYIFQDIRSLVSGGAVSWAPLWVRLWRSSTFSQHLGFFGACITTACAQA